MNRKILQLDAREYQALTPQQRLEKLFSTLPLEEILITSAFSTCSVYLLSLLARFDQKPQIHFIDTGYHFPETLEYVKQLAKYLHLEVVQLKPIPDDHDICTQQEMWSSNPDECCRLNKVKPIQAVFSQ